MFEFLLWPFRLVGSVIGFAFNLVGSVFSFAISLVGGIFGILFGGLFFVVSLAVVFALVRWFVRGVRGV